MRDYLNGSLRKPFDVFTNSDTTAGELHTSLTLESLLTTKCVRTFYFDAKNYCFRKKRGSKKISYPRCMVEIPKRE